MDEKILSEEILSNAELDNVSGGGTQETANDSMLLYEYGLVDDWHGNFHTTFNWHSDSKAVDEGWSKAGITCVTKPSYKNLYFKDGRELTRDEAFAYIRDNFQKIRSVD